MFLTRDIMIYHIVKGIESWNFLTQYLEHIIETGISTLSIFNNPGGKLFTKDKTFEKV